MSDTGQNITVQHQGQNYRIECSTTNQYDPQGFIHEYWPGHGVLGSNRKWLGHRYTRRLYWYAAVNPPARHTRPPAGPTTSPPDEPPSPGY